MPNPTSRALKQLGVDPGLLQWTWIQMTIFGVNRKIVTPANADAYDTGWTLSDTADQH